MTRIWAGASFGADGVVEGARFGGGAAMGVNANGMFEGGCLWVGFRTVAEDGVGNRARADAGAFWLWEIGEEIEAMMDWITRNSARIAWKVEWEDMIESG
ncbi:hypothetical protein L1987_43020 [Smallanthus sonchifolius]|uniref:Uncharacterized protein n=1 Tax=Smallanthus sonchifolius TaxID=185202 RepID=A0ACB9GK90_9ASTR|nr:hypothetical protein L1987_43020 [Smallanthus sonchifolius]